MWISNTDLKELLNGKMDEYWKRELRRKMERSEEREKARQEAARREKEKLWAKVAAVLRAEPNHRYCPTDIQFILYKAEGLQLSCTKISQILLRLYWLQRGLGTECFDPSVLMGIHMDPSWHPQGKRHDDRVYYYYTPEN